MKSARRGIGNFLICDISGGSLGLRRSHLSDLHLSARVEYSLSRHRGRANSDGQDSQTNDHTAPKSVHRGTHKLSLVTYQFWIR